MKKSTKIRENIFKPKTKAQQEQESESFPGYPKYPAEEDIYQQSLKESLNANDPEYSDSVSENQEEPVANHKNFEEDYSGNDLDVPGSELDDKQEDIGSEDEENNYYSLGGDNHNDLEENRDSEL